MEREIYVAIEPTRIARRDAIQKYEVDRNDVPSYSAPYGNSLSTYL